MKINKEKQEKELFRKKKHEEMLKKIQENEERLI